MSRRARFQRGIVHQIIGTEAGIGTLTAQHWPTDHQFRDLSRMDPRYQIRAIQDNRDRAIRQLRRAVLRRNTSAILRLTGIIAQASAQVAMQQEKLGLTKENTSWASSTLRDIKGEASVSLPRKAMLSLEGLFPQRSGVGGGRTRTLNARPKAR